MNCNYDYFKFLTFFRPEPQTSNMYNMSNGDHNDVKPRIKVRERNNVNISLTE